MATIVKLANVTRQMVLDADCVSAVDPAVPGYYKQVWTLTTPEEDIREQVAVGSELPPKTLEVQIDSENPEELRQLKELVEDAKGPLLENLWDLE